MPRHLIPAILKKQELNDEAFKKIVTRGGSCNSDHYATEILTYALQSKNMTSNARLLDVLNAATNINSDHYVTQVLMKAAPRVKGDATLSEAYRKAAKKIMSTHYYGQALRAID